MDSLTEKRLVSEIHNYSRMLSQDLSNMSNNLEKHSEFAESMNSDRFGGSMVGFKTNIINQMQNLNETLKKLQEYLGEAQEILNLDGLDKINEEYSKEF